MTILTVGPAADSVPAVLLRRAGPAAAGAAPGRAAGPQAGGGGGVAAAGARLQGEAGAARGAPAGTSR